MEECRIMSSLVQRHNISAKGKVPCTKFFAIINALRCYELHFVLTLFKYKKNKAFKVQYIYFNRIIYKITIIIKNQEARKYFFNQGMKKIHKI